MVAPAPDAPVVPQGVIRQQRNNIHTEHTWKMLLRCGRGIFLVLCTRKNALYRTAAEQNLSLRDPPQAENPAEQDSILGFTPYYKKRILGKRMQYYRQKME